jgi:hypothetical protein
MGMLRNFPTPSSNDKGSSLCKNLGVSNLNPCQTAYHLYSDDFLYQQYTSYTITDDDTIINQVFSGFASNGCTAMFQCNDYSAGMTDTQIKAA